MPCNQRWVILLVLMSFAASSAQPAPPAVADDLPEHQLLVIGDVHGSAMPMELLLRLIEDEANARKYDDIVVEFGNQKYQSLADDYLLHGKSIDLATLRPIWRDTLYFMAWQYAQYENLFLRLRELNQQRQHKIRMVLAEPEFEWKGLTKAQWEDLTETREKGYAEIIEQEVLAQEHTAILMFGAFHTVKQDITIAGYDKPFTSLVANLIHRSEVDAVVLWPHLAPTALPEDVIGNGFINLKNSLLGEVPLRQLTSRLVSAETLEQLADYYVYSGPEDNAAKIAPAANADSAWHDEVWRRSKILGGRVEQQAKIWLDGLGYQGRR
ncbi:hypothetical protein CA267_009255 [Alteromonas pelagimontana]|uniref:ChaN family lipoprotein n=1 Tax=Alteromonas pelagimontana TaxID=1858656 RepID=A0A6M4MCQ9_9ALTE|nr:hypothetical protein [Alteromonas pelagimontana]QJR80951.1 hypothetical protein CA267_009255 [Alteromonas pelagimontana]